MSKLIVMQGLPGSGKSTRALELMKIHGNAVRVGRDQLRTMLHFDKWNGKNEGITRDVQLAIVRHLLAKGNVVIIDDTNIQKSRIELWKGIAKETGAKLEWERMETSLEECIRRDALREKPIGRSVIVAMAMTAGMYPKPQKGIVICDLDGTLCNIEHRLHFVKGLPEGQKKDWKGFFAGIPEDTVNEAVLDMVMDYEGKGYEIFFVSGRGEENRDATEAWLEKVFQGYPAYKAVLMRRAGDHRPDTEAKEEIYDTCFKDLGVHLVIDDRPSVIRMWKSKGLNVIEIGSGEEF